MNIVLWILQVLIALHTAIGGIWKFSQSAEQTMPTFKVIPHEVWLGMGGVELICALLLLLPAVPRLRAVLHPSLIPAAAIIIVIEMLSFTGIHLISGSPDHSPIIYWLVVAILCGVVAYGRKPSSKKLID